VARMNRLLGQLRNEGGRNEQVANIDVGKILNETVNAMKADLPTIAMECQKNTIIVRANRDRFSSVVGHIIQNARDATPPDGRIVVRLRENGENALIEIEDNGSGMDDTFIRERLFRPFETTKGKSGMGIGAYETREFIRSLGGEVAVFSRLGHGTIFRLHIPRYIPGLGDIHYKTSNG
jgi:signal transduction histidine kinase